MKKNKTIIAVRHATANGQHHHGPVDTPLSSHANGEVNLKGHIESIFLGGFLAYLVKKGIIPPIITGHTSCFVRTKMTYAIAFSVMSEILYGNYLSLNHLDHKYLPDCSTQFQIRLSSESEAYLVDGWYMIGKDSFLQDAHILYDDITSLDKVMSLPHLKDSECALIVTHQPFLEKKFNKDFSKNCTGVIAGNGADMYFCLNLSDDFIKSNWELFKGMLYEVHEGKQFDDLIDEYNFHIKDIIKTPELHQFLQNHDWEQYIMKC